MMLLLHALISRTVLPLRPKRQIMSLKFTVHHTQAGNVLFMILIAIALIGFLSVTIMNSGNSDSANIDQETLVIRAAQVRSYVGELERGIQYIMQQNEIDISDIRFAHPDAHSDYGDLGAVAADDLPAQMFHPQGGGATYKNSPDTINDGSSWEFYGGTAIPAVGSSEADLVAVLPNVTQAFCRYINRTNGQPEELDDDGGALATPSNAGSCVNLGANGRFNDSVQFYSSPNTMDESSFAQDTTISVVKPAPQGCVLCAADSQRHFYHVISAR